LISSLGFSVLVAVSEISRVGAMFEQVAGPVFQDLPNDHQIEKNL